MSNEFYTIKENVYPSTWMILQQIGSAMRFDEAVFRLVCSEEYDGLKERKVKNPEVFRNCFIAVIGELRDTYSIRCDGLRPRY